MGYTPNLHLYLPQIGEQGYGEALNQNFLTLDAKIDELSQTANPNAYVPSGCQIIGCSITPPQGWLLCDGSEVLRSAYPDLFAAIGTAYGTPSSSSKFKLPNKVGRVVVGADPTTADPDYLLGKTGGAESVTLTVAQMPSHSHGGETGDDGSHGHAATAANAGKHGHTASSDEAGKHGHTASSNETGSHSHQVYEASIDYSNTMGSGGPSRTIRADSATGYAGTHSHTITVNENGDHTHTITVNENGDHTHQITVPNAPDHSHSIPQQGNNAAHENRMPYIAEFWWIKT